ncbi:uncharacterized protein K441DRAFT_665744 [Cenococcum geophilum 1.58]|uniref:uncharacterized protein n=1 Tax=Cenococcum geophilum 1.58 TaxID=794803 RepID=UPI00358EC133|nr:hypothetical protein K441DRAFT_665744 [Cenococcum geophilum 1.58]
MPRKSPSFTSTLQVAGGTLTISEALTQHRAPLHSMHSSAFSARLFRRPRQLWQSSSRDAAANPLNSRVSPQTRPY